MADFFRQLRRRIELEPGAEFDRRFWLKYEAEFGQAAARERRSAAGFRRAFLPVAAAMALTFGYLATHPLHLMGPGPEATLAPEAHIAMDLMSKRDLIADLDLLAAFEEIPVTDEDWNILLHHEEIPNEEA